MMSDLALDVYIYYQGNCREAMTFYKDIFGGELTLTTYGDTPKQASEGIGEVKPDNIMHSVLEGGDIKLMGSDTEKASKDAAKIDLSLGGSDETKLRDIFSKLAEGGEVHQPLSKMFWGDTFGSLSDKFGINWMMNITSAKES
jgi:PhnB protein